jgi:hypothetical protein
MDQKWFEMPDERRRKLAGAVWVPRAINRIEEVGRFGHLGYRSEFYGVGTIAVSTKKKPSAEKLGWMDVGISHNHSGWVEHKKYIPCDVYQDHGGKFSGLHLVLDQRGNRAEHSEWYLHQDFVITLGLRQEKDTWVRIDEGYIEIARLTRTENGGPRILEVRASHLKDYLCARGMVLYVTSYRSRVEVFEDANHITWSQNPYRETTGTDRWEGRVSAIHEGGMGYGDKTAVFHVARTDVDVEEDVPSFDLPTDAQVRAESWTKEHTGRKLYRVEGELWRNEWIDPAVKSPIVRGDKLPSTVFFITNSEGKKESEETLINGSRWLWFRPQVIPALAHRRGGFLGWYTRDTGNVGCSPSYCVHFGLNSIGLVNVYAKDIGQLPEWQQQIWSGYNVGPEGKVSEELLASQMKAEPADTLAPEAFLGEGLATLDQLFKEKFGVRILRPHEEIPHLLSRAHRFRATDKEGLFSLAKDLARLTANRFDASAIQKLLKPPTCEKWRSLKSLENLLATQVKPHIARGIMAPLVGIYELRHADAHLPSKEIEEALGLVRVTQVSPYVFQGHQLLHACVSSIYHIIKVIKKGPTS